MARNLQDELKRAEIGTKEYLAGLTSKTLSSQQKAREFLGRSRGQFFSGLSGVDPRSIPKVSGKLAGEAERTLSRQRLGLDRQRINLVYETAKRRAEMSGAEVQEAEQYARQVALDEMKRQAESSELQSNIESSKRKEELSDMYTQTGIKLQQQYSPQTDYNSALYRSLFGLGGAAATSSYLNRPNKNVEVPNIVSDKSSLRIGSGFSLPQYRKPYGFTENRGYY